MEFRHSGGSINTLAQYLVKRKNDILFKFVLLVLGFVLILAITWLPLEIRNTVSQFEIEKSTSNLRSLIFMIYPPLALLAFLVIQLKNLKYELFASYLLSDAGLTVFHKKKIKKNIKHENILGYKIEIKAKHSQIWIMYKNSFEILHSGLNFGHMDSDLCQKIEKYLNSKYKKFEFIDYDLQKPIN